MTQPSPDASWRDSARPSKLGIFNSSATFPLVFMLFHLSWHTFYIALAFMVFLTVIDHFGFSINVFFRLLRSTLAGPRKIAVPWWLA